MTTRAGLIILAGHRPSISLSELLSKVYRELLYSTGCLRYCVGS